VQPPEQSRSRGYFDNAIETKPHQGNTAGNEARHDGDEPFKAVVGDGEVFKGDAANGTCTISAARFFAYYYFVKVTNLLIFNGEIPGIGNLRRSRLVKKP